MAIFQALCVVSFVTLIGCSQSPKYTNYSLSAYSSFPEEMEGLISVWSKCSACLDHGICGRDTKAQCLNKTLPSRASALDHAIGRSNLQAMRYLVEVAGADVNEPVGEYQETSLHIASYYGAETPRNYEVMKYLLDRGADVHARTVGGDFHWSPLRTAVWKNKITAVKLLIQYGAFTDEDSVRGLVWSLDPMVERPLFHCYLVVANVHGLRKSNAILVKT